MLWPKKSCGFADKLCVHVGLTLLSQWVLTENSHFLLAQGLEFSRRWELGTPQVFWGFWPASRLPKRMLPLWVAASLNSATDCLQQTHTRPLESGQKKTSLANGFFPGSSQTGQMVPVLWGEGFGGLHTSSSPPSDCRTDFHSRCGCEAAGFQGHTAKQERDWESPTSHHDSAYRSRSLVNFQSLENVSFGRFPRVLWHFGQEGPS